MASLLEHDRMAGAVQCVYFDPPYGMDLDAKYLNDTLHVQAFRDAYKDGINSYLDNIRETVGLIREVLSEQGSLFFQIGDTNVHRCACILDEVGGPANRVTTISFATTGGGSSSKSIAKSADYILWYSKNREKMHFQTLDEDQDIKEWLNTQTLAGGGGGFLDGSRPLRTQERRNPDKLQGVRLWRMRGLTSQGPSDGEQGQPYNHEGVEFGPKGLENRHWTVDRKGLDALAESGRLWTNVRSGIASANANQLHLKVYQNEMPGRRINNIWARQISVSKKTYSVQTGERAVERCMLMTTRPGDLVLDPTGGSGTTAAVAEEWGRRWISIDSSRLSIAVQRQRICISGYSPYLLVSTVEGHRKENEERSRLGLPILEPEVTHDHYDPASGFVYKRQQRITAAVLAYRNRDDKKQSIPETITHQNRLFQQEGRVKRVASPFTVETEQVERYEDPEMLRFGQTTTDRRDRDWFKRITEALLVNGVTSDAGLRMNLEHLEDWAEKLPEAIGVTHTAVLVDPKSGKRINAVLSILPEDMRATPKTVQRAVHQAGIISDVRTLLVVTLDFSPEFEASKDRFRINIVPIRADRDLQIRSINAADGNAFTLVAEPDISVTPDQGGSYSVSVNGWSEYNLFTGESAWNDCSDIMCWLLDTDYDRNHFCAHYLHFIGEQRKTDNRRSITDILDRYKPAIRTVLSRRSVPFPAPRNGEIAVRIVTNSGAEMARVIQIPPK